MQFPTIKKLNIEQQTPGWNKQGFPQTSSRRFENPAEDEAIYTQLPSTHAPYWVTYLRIYSTNSLRNHFQTKKTHQT